MPDKNAHTRGFTLIELLIAIALIGILSSLGIYSYQNSQRKARDAQRKNDLAQVKRALESAKNDCLAGSYYPVYSATGGSSNQAFGAYLMQYLTGSYVSYLDQQLVDPKNSGNHVYHYYRSTSTQEVCPDPQNGTANSTRGIKTYVLRAILEISNDPDSAKSKARCENLFSQISQPLVPAYVAGDYYECPD